MRQRRQAQQGIRESETFRASNEKEHSINMVNPKPIDPDVLQHETSLCGQLALQSEMSIDLGDISSALAANLVSSSIENPTSIVVASSSLYGRGSSYW